MNFQRKTIIGGWVNEVGRNMFADNEREIKFYKWENYVGKCEKLLLNLATDFVL